MTTTSLPTGWQLISCPACGQSGGSEVFTARNLRYGIDVTATVVSCDDCGLMRTDPQPDDEFIASLYKAGEYYTHDQPAPDNALSRAKKQARTVAQRLMVKGPAAKLRAQVEARTDLERYTSRFAIEEFSLKRGQSMLDIGCGGGKVLELVRGMGLETLGVEPDPSAREAAERRGLRVIDSLDECDETFDRIILRHVLEHVPAPVDVLATARQHLKADGRIMIAVPNAKADQAEAFGQFWEGWDLPRHRWHFSAQTLTDVCARAGLKVTHLRSVELDAFARASVEHRAQQGVEAADYSPSDYQTIEQAMRGR